MLWPVTNESRSPSGSVSAAGTEEETLDRRRVRFHTKFLPKVKSLPLLHREWIDSQMKTSGLKLPVLQQSSGARRRLLGRGGNSPAAPLSDVEEETLCVLLSGSQLISALISLGRTSIKDERGGARLRKRPPLLSQPVCFDGFFVEFTAQDGNSKD
ncbi:unnamed protein product [Pleuronectes platessa]|uniref:Uncharacterized protein n=1 Tax=Pleuronectes platessa TaxID=8262 RepID=A0A9N7Y816_PLEPL|nr:unnamed protein product [Pleuronectes platessa]